MADTDALWTMIAANRFAALATLKRDGRPQISNIIYAYDADDRTAIVSVTASRAKTANLRRDPRASLYVTSADRWSYVVAEGDASLTEVAADPDDEVVEALVDYYRRLSGEHPDWDEFRRTQVAEGRLVARIRLDHVYGIPARA
ncbi:PPOX class probable F420-dependent enzyme [Mumia flava]|uniref:PPOX class probable F420-dependent enzyme n=1 Tax=Mumia flava TaxID=1348852 RepID=A0A0B2BH29_9ACTN|nr:PPOX class F420-dependent oxidoreductase [Mumia flava]PJJ54262.1 PPOX class probable F420-dependent enzyme [Mumia flava]